MQAGNRDQEAGTDPGVVMARNDRCGAGACVTAGLAASATGLRRSWPLLVPGAVAVITGGLIAAGVAHDPTSATVWLAAYLVLVVGVAQLALAIGQALLASPTVSIARIRLESVLFNVGSAGVIVGTIGGVFVPVLFGTLLFFGALGAFLRTVRATVGDCVAHAYRALIALLSISALVGVLLSAARL